jgi:hypothetical protein
MRRVFGLGFLSALPLAVGLFLGAQLAPAAERGAVGDDHQSQTTLEFVGRAEQTGGSISMFGYVTHVAGLDDAALFATPNVLSRNEQTARITFFGTTTVTQSFMVLPPPAVPSMFDVDSTGKLTFLFMEVPNGRTFASPSSFASGTQIASESVRFQDIVAALVGVDPTRGVVDGNGELCQQTVNSFHLDGESQRLGHLGLAQHVVTHGWTVRTSPNPPQSFTHFAGHTTPVGESHC